MGIWIVFQNSSHITKNGGIGCVGISLLIMKQVQFTQ